jgi:hypothetical protein
MAATDDTGDEPDWEAIARCQLASEAEDRSRRLDAYVGDIEDDLRSREATPETIYEFRRRMDALLHTVEHKIAGVIEGVEPYDSASYLRDTAQATEASDGATLQLGTDELRRLCNGQPVTVETEGGIEIGLEAKTLAETEAGP